MPAMQPEPRVTIQGFTNTHRKRKENMLMNYEEFKQQIVDDLKDRLGEDYKFSVNEVKMLNQSYEAVAVTPEGSNIGVNMSLDKLYDAIQNDVPYETVVDRTVDAIENGFDQAPKFDVNMLSDYEQMKNKLAMEVVSAEANAEMLETVPHKNIEDMAVVYRFVLESSESGGASVLVTNQLLENMGVTPEQLHADAMENAPQLRPAVITGMSELMAEMMGVDQAEMMGLIVKPEDEKMFVATVPDKTHGAGVLAYQDFMDQAAERVGGDFFVLPSSIHEVMLVPDNGVMQYKDLLEMVRDANATLVAPSDRLTDSVYHYDSKEKIFELAEKFVERQESREEAAVKEAVTDEKGSLLDDLKAKKDEVLKSPKKEASEKTKSEAER